MGRKVHPIGFRLKVNKTWEGRWYAEGENYVNQLHQDLAVRELVREHSPRAGVSRIEVERFPHHRNVENLYYTAVAETDSGVVVQTYSMDIVRPKPGIVIHNGGIHILLGGSGITAVVIAAHLSFAADVVITILGPKFRMVIGNLILD